MDYNKKLIQVVRLHEFIYDSQHPHYGDNALKNETWKEIAGLLQVSGKISLVYNVNNNMYGLTITC